MLRELRPGLCYVLCGASRRIAARATWASLEHFGLLGNYFLGFYEGLRDNNALVGVVGLLGIIRPTARRSGDCQPR